MDPSPFSCPVNDLSSLNSTEHQNTADKEAMIKTTFDLLKKGETNIELSEEHKSVILILGNTGSGKSTFTQWLAGDNSKLIAIETNKGTGEFIIKDDNRIGNSTIKSKTVFPELVIDPDTNSAYYDCPGFSDTNTANDIATTYFIKKVIDYADSVKLVFLANHPSVRKGVDRLDFMKLMKHATDLVKDVDKFRNSIALVATKVDNQYVRQDKSFVLVDSEKVIEAIADFLREVEQDLNRMKVTATKDQTFYEKVIKFVSVLVEKVDGHYSRIGIFRRPDEPGPLSNSTLMQEGKEHVQRIIHEKLRFIKKDNDDFGYTVSERSKNDISDLVETINKRIWCDIGFIANGIHEYYRNLTENVHSKIKSFVAEDSADIKADQSEARSLSTKLKNGYNIALILAGVENVTDIEDLAKTLSRIDAKDANIYSNYVLDIANQGNYLNFLQTVSDEKLSTWPWTELFKGAVTYLNESRKSIQDDVEKVAEELIKLIKTNIDQLTFAMQEHFENTMKSLEIQKLPSKIRSDYSIMRHMSREVEYLTNTAEVTRTIRLAVDNLSMCVPKIHLQNIANYGKYFEFSRIITEKELKDVSSTWAHSFEDIVRHLDESRMWYSFLNDLYLKFSKYEIQRERHKYNVADLRNWGKSGEQPGIEIKRSTYELFLRKMENYRLRYHDNIKNITVTGLRLQELNHVLSITLRHTVSMLCKEPYIFIKGDYISIKETILSRESNTEVGRTCLNYASLLESGKFKSINIFALNTVFIDSDLSLEKVKLPLTVIAPKWEIVGTRQINLNGADGKLRFSTRARDSTLEGGRGTDGKPGEPGEPGGTFFAIGTEFVNGSNLRITASGGKGSSGQNGGNGQSGRNGKTPWTPSAPDNCGDLCDNGKKINDFRCEKYEPPSPPKGGSSWFNMPILTAAVIQVGFHSTSFDYKIFGKGGSRGGDGGNGGKGGKGGNVGFITLLELEGSSGIQKHTEKGIDGRDGVGGKGGQGGRHGNDIIASCVVTDPTGFQALFSSRTLSWQMKSTIEDHGKGPSGRNGGSDIPSAPSKAGSTVEAPANIINEYKSFLRETLTDRFKKYSSTDFLNQLDSSNKTKNVYDTLGLINELETLEKQNYKLSEELNFLPFYQSLLNKVNEYAVKPKQNEDSVEYYKVLKFLVTATLSRIYSLKGSSEPNLIIDIKGYLDIIGKDIRSLENIKNANVKAIVIKKYTEKYKSGIEDKIKEAEGFIKEQLMPEMNLINSQIDSEINSLIDELIDLKGKSKEEIHTLVEKREDLRRKFALRGIFNCLKLFAQAASFFGPVGKVAGLATGTIVSITESLVLDKGGQMVDIPKSNVPYLPRLKRDIKTVRIKKFADFKDLLEEISREVNGHLELEDLSLKINDLKKRFDDVKENEFDVKQIRTLKKELKRELRREAEKLKIEDKISIEKKVKALKLVQKFEQIAKLGSLFVDIINQKKNEQERIDEIDRAIQQEEDKFHRLEEYEDQIYDTIAPMLLNMENYLDDVINKLDTKSQVTLDVTKWRIQSILKDVKLQMRQLTQNFEDSNIALERCIEKLDDVMSTSINIYDRIQNYQQDQDLANFIADITSAAANNIDISNPKLIDAVNHLDMLIRSNLVLMEYKTAINALKQWVFPFARNYLEKSQLPSPFELDESMDRVVSKAVEQIDNVRRKISLYRVFVVKDDEYKFTGDFSSRYNSSMPFFVWKNEQYKNEISELFSGREIALKADVNLSDSNKDAIKFYAIDVNFKSKNETIQTQIHNTLAGFDIKMIHTGNSYYRYDDKIYLITSTNVTIIHSWERDDDKVPLRKNDVYTKIQHGNLTLSPYAMWKFQLIKATDTIPFHALEVFKDQIDLELIGCGSYVDKRYNVKVPIEDEYVAIEKLNESNPFLVNDNTCTKSNTRYSRSVDHHFVSHLTSSAAPKLSSPINYLVNLMKTYIMSNLLPSINENFSVKRDIFSENKFNEKSALPFKTTGDSLEDSSRIISLTSATKINRFDGVVQENETTRAAILTHSSNEVIYISDDETINMDCYPILHDNSNSISYSKHFLDDKQKFHLLSVPYINCSLLLADLITRSVTGNKYKYSAHKVLTPQEITRKKINDSIIQNEYDIRRTMLAMQHETEIKYEISWLSTIKACAKSSFQFLGFVETENIDLYIQDNQFDIGVLRSKQRLLSSDMEFKMAA
ncbi:uncharacterized protein TNCV_1980241 [Trichonephila clavipes]|nr:uncharacterized protein TNCV_1980241 [Trichonephila clavipes]